MRRDCQRAATSQSPPYPEKETETETETETVMEMEMEMEKERDEETWPACEAESSKEGLVLLVCKASLVVEACGEGRLSAV